MELPDELTGTRLFCSSGVPTGSQAIFGNVVMKRHIHKIRTHRRAMVLPKMANNGTLVFKEGREDSR